MEVGLKDAIRKIWKEFKRRVVGAWREFQTDPVLLLILGVSITLAGGIASSPFAIGFGLGASFASAIVLSGRRKDKGRCRDADARILAEWKKLASRGCKHMAEPPISVPQFPPKCKLTGASCSPFNCPIVRGTDEE